ncbi:MAG: hypothetical protein K0U78_21360 [Actinomycetia bacterium]|nr:hypothetical protein [Actinomycetes bacterium]
MTLVLGASWCCTLAGVVLGIAALAVFRQPMLALRTAMDLLIVAGVLRLSIDPSWTAIAGTVAVIALRRVLAGDLRSDLTAAQDRAQA